MQYLGGKFRLGKKLAAAIAANTDLRGAVYEPFVGGGSMTPHLAQYFETVHIGDVHPDLMLMWKAVYSGWEPPTEVSEERYRELKTSEPSAERGFVGFSCSFAGKWFGGYARGSDGNYALAGRNSILKKVRGVGDKIGEIKRQPYYDWQPESGDVVYCDPPYLGTQGYSGTSKFDHDKFYSVVETWAAEGVQVFVSEYSAPGHWEEVFSKDHTVFVVNDGNTKTEKLFKVVPNLNF